LPARIEMAGEAGRGLSAAMDADTDMARPADTSIGT
jgi:hypothetical protein